MSKIAKSDLHSDSSSIRQTIEKRPFIVEEVRADFPILHQTINGYPLVYLDNAATTQKPQCVIDAISDYYTHYNSNVHRGAHTLADKATKHFENARQVVAEALNSPLPEQVIWTRGTTEAINIVAHSWCSAFLSAGDKILVSELEHHSNIVPWQLAAQRCGADVLPIPVTDSGDINMSAFASMLDDTVKLVAVGQVSNALGTVNPITDIIHLSHSVGAKVLVDGAQGIAHFDIDVQSMDCDFYTFSGHKLFGPTGIGVLWGKKELLDAMPPYQGGGEMIETVSFSGTTFNTLPYKFEAGTPDIAGAIGLAAAFKYIAQFDRQELSDHEHDLLSYCQQKAEKIHGLRRVGDAKTSTAVFSFLVEGTHPADIGMLLDQQGVAIRTGHHCTQPLMARYCIPGTARASFSIYNTRADIDLFIAALKKVLGMLR